MKERAVDRERAVVANHQMAEVAEPREGALDFPASSITSQCSSILGHRLASIPTMRRDQFDPARRQPCSQRVAVVTTIGDQAQRFLPRPPRGCGGLRGSSQAWFPRAGLPPGRQSEGSLPKEDRGRRPPPSTSCPCPAWFFRLQRPFFGGSKTPVQKRLAPLQLFSFVEFCQKCAPDFQPNALLLPIPQPSPAGRGMRILLGQVLPASTAPQNPQNPFQDTAVVDPRTATLAVLARLGKQGSDFLPLHFRQQRTRPGHRPSFGAADFAYLASEKTQLPSFQEPVLGYATASRSYCNTGSVRKGVGV